MKSVSLEEIYENYHDKVRSFILRKTQDMTLAEDLTEDVFLKMVKNFDSYDSEKAAVSTWVYTIANNTVTDYFRTRKVTEELPADNGEDGAVPSFLIDPNSVEGEVLGKEASAVLADALRALSERDRDLIILHYYSGMTLKEVADKLGMSYANAKVVHKKALDILKLRIGDRL